MIINAQEDLRIQRTKESIREAFKQLMCEIDYEKITIKELTERARINRKTFYLHYSKLEDLLVEMRKIIIADYLKRMEAYKLPKDLPMFIREFFLHQEELGVFGQRIICTESNSYTLDRMSNLVVTNSSELDLGKDDCAGLRQKIVRDFASKGILGIYKMWLTDGKRIPLEDIIEMVTELVCNGTNGYLWSHQNDQPDNSKEPANFQE